MLTEAQSDIILPQLDVPTRLREFTTHGGNKYVQYMNHIGWFPEGMFTKLLSSADYPFDQSSDRVIARKHSWRVAAALATLIFEQ